MSFRILTGMSNTKIRHELTKLSEPTLKDYKRKVVKMEVAWQMESSIAKTRKTIAAVVKGKSGKAGKMSLRDCQKSMKGKCYRCGDPSHMSAECKKEKVTCNACGKEGHMSKVCLKRMICLLYTSPSPRDRG